MSVTIDWDEIAKEPSPKISKFEDVEFRTDLDRKAYIKLRYLIGFLDYIRKISDYVGHNKDVPMEVKRQILELEYEAITFSEMFNPERNE